MKRVWPAWLFLFLGAFFLVTAGIAQFWAPDAAERTPLNSYQRTYLTGTADVLDPATGKTNHDPVKITNITQVDDDKSTGDDVVFVTSTCVNVDTGDPADCLPKSDPRMISVTQLNFVADRHDRRGLRRPEDPRHPGARVGPGQQVAVPRREEELRRLGRRHQDLAARRLRRARPRWTA